MSSAPGSPVRLVLVAAIASSLTRQTWNFRHLWVMLAIVAAGCGDDDNNGIESGGGGKVTGVQAGTGSRRDEAGR